MSIYDNQIVTQELERMNGLIGSETDREVEVDITILTEALDRINLLLNGDFEYIYIDANMWEEASDSLVTILDELNLEVDKSSSDFEESEWMIVFKN